MKTLLTVILVMVLILSFFSCSQEKEEIIDFTLAPEHLYDCYESNWILADSEFTDKILTVRGEIGLISRDDTGKAYFIFRGGPVIGRIEGFPLIEGRDFNMPGMQVGGVLCRFDKKDESQLTGVREGDYVSVKGECKGLDKDYVTLNHCAVVKKDS